MRPGRTGSRQVSAIAYALPAASLDWWAQRLTDEGVTTTQFERFGERGLAFGDPDGMPVELIGVTDPPELPAWEGSPVPPGHRLRGFHSATLTLNVLDGTRRLLTEVFGLAVTDEAGSRTRLSFSGGAVTGGILDIVVDREGDDHGLGAGIVHHIAFRARDHDEQRVWHERVTEFGLRPTPFIDRDYFTAIYFREPGGVLFEIATDPPGFTRDESLAELGTGLKLPDQHEHLRAQLERDLSPIPPVEAS
jgi:glyoxalase family protein